MKLYIIAGRIFFQELNNKWTIYYYNADEVFEKIATDEMIYDTDKWQEFKKDI